MHIAAANPQAVDVDGLDPAFVERERAVLTEQAKESGKPDARHREDGRGPLAQILRGGRAAVAGLRPRSGDDRRQGACRDRRERPARRSRSPASIASPLARGSTGPTAISRRKLRGAAASGSLSRRREADRLDARSNGDAQRADRLRYRRVLVKLSGEALMGENGYGIDVDVLNRVAGDVCEAAGSRRRALPRGRRRQHLSRPRRPRPTAWTG